MKIVQTHRKTIRFRRWSRKAYAAFASLGQWVTIGCLPKGVADSSLSKQKAGAAAKCESGGQGMREANGDTGRETDTEMLLSCKNGLATALEGFGFKGVQPASHPVANVGGQGEKHTDIITNKSRTRMTRTIQAGENSVGIVRVIRVPAFS